jgi:hypothetical protein
MLNAFTIWKEDWDKARTALEGWWRHKSLALHVTAPADKPILDFPLPYEADLETRWLDPDYRFVSMQYHASHTFFGGASFPLFSPDIGPGSLGLFLGCTGHLAPDTVWYDPSISDPENCGNLTLDMGNAWWKHHMDLLKIGEENSAGRWIVGMPDLIENLDTLAQLRGPQQTLYDLVERPDWVLEKIHEINIAYFEAFDRIYHIIETPWGGNAYDAFRLWGPGKTAKVQCDLCCTISPAMFRRFVMPALEEQCCWLDYSMFHLDGTQAMPQLENLLSIEELDAVEWTPQTGIEGGGNPRWYDLYRRIKSAGKSVQAIGVLPEEVEPLIDAVGPEGMFISTWTKTETEARRMLSRTGWN